MGDPRISAGISDLKKKRIKALVKLGVFKSQAAFLRTAIDRLLEEIEEIKLGQRREVEKAKRREEEQTQAMREIVDFTDNL